jgi:AraC-like DNA-binding protein
MQIDVINQYFFEDRTEFKTPIIKRRWDILIMVVDGVYSIRPTESKKAYLIRKGEMVYIPAGTEVERRLLEPTTHYHIAFYSQADHPFRLSMPAGKLSLAEEQTAPIFKSMKRAFLIPDNRELIPHIVEHIFAEHYLFGKSRKAKLRHLSEEVLSTVSYMNKNLQKQIDMNELAARVYLSHSGLIWKFRQELGTTPSQYLILLRLRYAKQLLLNHPYTIAEVAELCGYSNPFYFTNAFHRYAGMSPSEFRKHHLEESEK